MNTPRGRVIAFVHANKHLPSEASQLAEAGTCDLIVSTSGHGYPAALAALDDALEPGDTLKIASTQVFEVSVRELLYLFERLLNFGITLQIGEKTKIGVHDEKVNGKDLIALLSEHSRYHHRLATQKGASVRPKSGRNPKLLRDQLPTIRHMLETKSAADVAADLGVSRTTLFRFLQTHSPKQ